MGGHGDFGAMCDGIMASYLPVSATTISVWRARNQIKRILMEPVAPKY